MEELKTEQKLKRQQLWILPLKYLNVQSNLKTSILFKYYKYYLIQRVLWTCRETTVLWHRDWPPECFETPLCSGEGSRQALLIILSLKCIGVNFSFVQKSKKKCLGL